MTLAPMVIFNDLSRELFSFAVIFDKARFS